MLLNVHAILKNTNHNFRRIKDVYCPKKMQVLLDIACYSRSIIAHGNSQGIIVEGTSGY
jgi:hypothetical protein